MLKPVVYFTLVTWSALVLAGCSDRRAAEAQFLGTWSRANFDSTADLSFYPDHTFILSGESLGEYTVFDRGTWHLDYKRILLRRKDRDEGALVIMSVSDVTSDELKISHADYVETYKREKAMTPEEIPEQGRKARRVHRDAVTIPRQASNQAMQRTAGRSAF